MEKQCTSCKKWYPESTDFFIPEKRNKSGVGSICKNCRKSIAKVYNRAPEAKKRHAEKQREWAKKNPEKAKGSTKKWFEKHPEKKKEYKDRDYQKNKDKYQKRANDWYYAHKNDFTFKLNILIRQIKYRKENPDINRANIHRRRTLVRNSHGSHTAEDIKKQYEEQGGKCFYCKKDVSKDYHVDHVIPLSRGGSNNPDNLVIACPTCNTSKGAKLLSEWKNKLSTTN